MVSLGIWSSRREKIGTNDKSLLPPSKLADKKFQFKCAACQKFKLAGKGYGLLQERELKEQPFQECAVDLIGPWSVKIHGKEHTFLALTIINPVTNLTELVRIDNKESE